MTTLMKQV